MKKLALISFICGSLFSTFVFADSSTTTSFDVAYENYVSKSYRDCGSCIGYYSDRSQTASIVLYEKNNQAYWVLNISKNEGRPTVEFYFVDRSPDLAPKFQGFYYPVQDVSEAFEFKELEIQPGGHIVGKLHPVKAKSLGKEKVATFSGSFDIHLHE